eukprot:TRINITY_DN6205_c0_g1_i1.p1 TRINITY_DN6205_c0_g1~~TRINITY_DN6205_c0_g1_i1.p1  ORF type:complete len:311 (+),score=12.66 TRINITY_DN6205_c0_g1_i1:1-933(+)
MEALDARADPAGRAEEPSDAYTAPVPVPPPVADALPGPAERPVGADRCAPGPPRATRGPHHRTVPYPLPGLEAGATPYVPRPGVLGGSPARLSRAGAGAEPQAGVLPEDVHIEAAVRQLRAEVQATHRSAQGGGVTSSGGTADRASPARRALGTRAAEDAHLPSHAPTSARSSAAVEPTPHARAPRARGADGHPDTLSGLRHPFAGLLDGEVDGEGLTAAVLEAMGASGEFRSGGLEGGPQTHAIAGVAADATRPVAAELEAHGVAVTRRTRERVAGGAAMPGDGRGLYLLRNHADIVRRLMDDAERGRP